MGSDTSRPLLELHLGGGNVRIAIAQELKHGINRGEIDADIARKRRATSAKSERDSYLHRERYLGRLGIGRPGGVEPVSTQKLSGPYWPRLTSDLLHDSKTDKKQKEKEEEEEFDRTTSGSSSTRRDSYSSLESSTMTVDSLPAVSQCSESSLLPAECSNEGSLDGEPPSDSEPDLIMTPRGQTDASTSRMKLLQKLSYEGVWRPTPQRAPSHQTLIIFDWDDTLLASSFLCAMGKKDISLQRLEQIRASEAASVKLLQLAISLGQTIIITNAVDDWVLASAKCWAPRLLPLLRKVKVISARSRYEAQYPHDPMSWKAAMFLEVRRQFNPDIITNLISIGDADYEMEAAQAMAREFKSACVKLIKFRPRPSASELTRQSEVACEGLARIVGKARNIRVRLQEVHSDTDKPGTDCRRKSV